ncbi:MAG: alpha/beta hydrolase [Candidatus Eremiobacteraeota bacterium]|nr:alpha/beta hydrolase [Candidatus Eremiobacteraeota bacterium]
MHATIFALLAAVNVVKDVAYGVDVAGGKHRLDVYAAMGARAAPVLMFVYGGGFVQGDRRDYNGLAVAIAATGIVVVVPSYRLFPQTDARGAASDVAAAIAWTVKHVARYGGNPNSVVLSGHSSGAYLATLVGYDPEFLSADGISVKVIRGIAGFSGVYDMRDFAPDSSAADIQILQRFFGATREARTALSPITYVSRASPPTVLFCGGIYDASACAQRDQLFAALVGVGAPVEMDSDPSATHIGVVANLSRNGTQEQRSLLDFVAKYGH